MAVKELVASIIQFLTQQLEDGDVTEDFRESLEVAIQCLESTYDVRASDAPINLNLIDVFTSACKSAKPNSVAEATPEAKEEAESLKNAGNILMKSEKYKEALKSYTDAIKLDSRNAVYYGNRAAVHSKLGDHNAAIKDCRTALAIDPSYSKAYGRLGLAYSGLNQHKEARDAYQKAVEMEPENESYRSNLQLTEEKLALGGRSAGGFENAMPDLNSLLTNPALMNMARQMLTDPEMQNMMRNLMSNNAEPGGGRMDALLEAGQRLAQTLQNSNPDIIESLRRQTGDTNDPDPSQKS